MEDVDIVSLGLENLDPRRREGHAAFNRGLFFKDTYVHGFPARR
jgi:hypothetical protein